MIGVRPPLINGVEYTHADIILQILGVPIVGLTSIDYRDMQEITANHGTGHLPVSVGIGAVSFEGTLTMTMKEVQRLTASAPFGRIQNIPLFDIRVNYLTEAGDIVSHKLKSCKFKGRNPNSSVNNTQIEEALELFIADIDYNATT
jgi:hypothetical protein